MRNKRQPLIGIGDKQGGFDVIEGQQVQHRLQSAPQSLRDAADFDLLSLPQDYFDDPFPYFQQLRDRDPIHANKDGSLLLTRYEDVKVLWRDLSGLVDKREKFERRFGPGALLEHHTTGMLFRDPPDHDRLRALVNPFFSQASIDRLRDFVAEKVNRLLDEVAERGTVDFVKDFAFRLPIAVICRILGLPEQDGDHIHQLGIQILFPLNPDVSADAVARGHQAAAAFKDYLRGHVEAARRRVDLDPQSDIISALVAAERRGEPISEEEILHMCILMLNGGHETTTNLIAVSIHSLLGQPEQLQLYRETPEIGSTAIEELIRFVSPLQLQGRRTTRPVSLPSGTIPSDTEVVICQASANRDERVFEQSDRLNLERRPNAHLAFGAGVHVCIGRPLARLEAGIALPKLLKRFRRIERTGTPVFNRNARFRGLSTLPLSFQE
jgi:cytochrome P450